MRLSIITINLNNKDGLIKTMESILSQTFRDFEWIIIDGGSTDGSKELIKQHSGNLAYWISEKDNGVYNAMNKGVSHASGDYVLFLNSGDYLTDDSVLETVFSNEYDSDILYGDIIICDGTNIVERRVYDDVLSFNYLMKWSIGHPSSFIKRQLLIDSPYNESYKIVSDKEFFLKQALMGSCFLHVPCFVSCFDTNGISSSQIELVQNEEKQMIKATVPQPIYCDYSVKYLSEFLSFRNSKYFERVMHFSIRLLQKLNDFNR